MYFSSITPAMNRYATNTKNIRFGSTASTSDVVTDNSPIPQLVKGILAFNTLSKKAANNLIEEYIAFERSNRYSPSPFFTSPIPSIKQALYEAILQGDVQKNINTTVAFINATRQKTLQDLSDHIKEHHGKVAQDYDHFRTASLYTSLRRGIGQAVVKAALKKGNCIIPYSQEKLPLDPMSIVRIEEAGAFPKVFVKGNKSGVTLSLQQKIIIDTSIMNSDARKIADLIKVKES